jgi:hypothetical protein
VEPPPPPKPIEIPPTVDIPSAVIPSTLAAPKPAPPPPKPPVATARAIEAPPVSQPPDLRSPVVRSALPAASAAIDVPHSPVDYTPGDFTDELEIAPLDEPTLPMDDAPLAVEMKSAAKTAWSRRPEMDDSELAASDESEAPQGLIGRLQRVPKWQWLVAILAIWIIGAVVNVAFFARPIQLVPPRQPDAAGQTTGDGKAASDSKAVDSKQAVEKK